MDRGEKLAWVLIVVVLVWGIFFGFFVLKPIKPKASFTRVVFAQELDSKCDVGGRIIQDAAFHAQLYLKLPLVGVWVPAGYFQEGVRLQEVRTEEKNIICASGDLTLAEGLLFSETNSQAEGEKITLDYRILAGERKNLSLEMTNHSIKVLRAGNKPVSKTYLINSLYGSVGSVGIQELFVYLRNGSAGDHLLFFPFDNRLYSARFYRPTEDALFYQAVVSPVENTGKENAMESVREVFIKVKDGRISEAEAVFNNRLKVVLTRASE